MLDAINYRKVLLIGTGGGNDIVSTTLIAAYLQNRGIVCDIAGVCSPAALHHFDKSSEWPFNIIRNSAQRSIECKKSIRISFIDGFIPTLCKANGLKCNVFDFSFRYGTDNVMRMINSLVESYQYDAVIAVDVGGDILARGPQDPTILSPLMDFSTLHVLSKIEAPTFLIEIGLQTDGELRPQGCSEILADLQARGAILSTETISKNDPEVQIFSHIYNGVKHIRAGNTARMLFETLNATEDIVSPYRQTYQLLNKKWEIWGPITLEKKYFGKLYLIDLPKVTSALSFGYKHPLEQFLRMKKIVDTRTELDLLYAIVKDDEGKPPIIVWLGTVAPQFSEHEKEILELGISQLDSHADVALIWAKNAPKYLPGKLAASNGFIVFGNDFSQVQKIAPFLHLAEN